MTSTPSIRISQHRRYHTPPDQPAHSSAPAPMAIPRAREPVPPPLPPPSYIPELSAGQDPGWQWGNDPNRSDFGRPAAVKPGSSLLGGGKEYGRRDDDHEAFPHNSLHDARRGSSVSTVTAGHTREVGDEGLGHMDEQRRLSKTSSNYGYVGEHHVGLACCQRSV